MATDWRPSTWGEEISLEYGKALRGHDTSVGRYRVFGSNGPIGWTEQPLAPGPGVILGRKGAYRGVEFSREPFFVIDTAYYVVPKGELDMRWLYYAIKHHKLGEIDDGSPIPSTTRAAVYIRDMHVPQPQEQRAIAEVLGSLDDKIELNRRMNETLEAIARAIFKSWFVDFDPVKAKAAGATRFPTMPQEVFDALPTKFTDSPLGPIPKGWETRKPNDLFDFILGGDWGKGSVEGEFTESTYCVRGADIPSLQSGGLGKMPSRFLKTQSLSKRKLLAGDLIFEISGGSPTQSTGRAVLVTDCLVKRLDQPLVCSNFCRMLRPTTFMPSEYVYQLLRWLYDNDQFLQYETGTTGIKNLAFAVFAKKHDVLVPTEDVLWGFRDVHEPLIEHHGLNGCSSDTLAEIRDALLPKLLSGEIRVGAAEKIVEEVA